MLLRPTLIASTHPVPVKYVPLAMSTQMGHPGTKSIESLEQTQRQKKHQPRQQRINQNNRDAYFWLICKLTRHLLYMEKAAQHAVLLRCNMHVRLQAGMHNGPLLLLLLGTRAMPVMIADENADQP